MNDATLIGDPNATFEHANIGNFNGLLTDESWKVIGEANVTTTCEAGEDKTIDIQLSGLPGTLFKDGVIKESYTDDDLIGETDALVTLVTGAVNIYIWSDSDNKDFASADKFTASVTNGKGEIAKVDPGDPTPETIKYRQNMKLSNITLTPAENDGPSWEWVNPDTAVTAGSNTAAVKTSGNDTYNAVASKNITFTVAPGDVTIGGTLTAEVASGTKLNTLDPATLGVTATDAGGATVSGTLAWAAADPSAVTITGSTVTQAVKFTPANSSEYNTPSNVNFGFTLEAAKDTTLTLGKTSDTYSGSSVAPTVTVTEGANTLTENTDYTVAWTKDGAAADVIDAGTYTCTITMKNTERYNAPEAATFTVEPKELTITWNTPVFADKEYNGKDKTDIAEPTSGKPTLSDGATPTVTYTRASSGVGDNITVKAEITGFTGVSETNYKLPSTVTNDNYGTVKVTAKELTVGAGTLAVTEKTYDTTTDATVTGTAAITAGKIEGDDVSVAIDGTPAFADADAGSNKDVTVNLELSGSEAGNYTLSSNSVTIQGTITKADITGQPSISWASEGKVGDTITVAKGTLNVELTVVDVKWMRGSTEISGQTGTTYTITADDIGESITAVVTAKTNGNYQGSATSNALEPGKTALTGTPTISGTASVGETLTLDVSPLNAAANATDVSNIDIQWYRGDEAISGATGLTYEVTKADQGKALTAKVTAKEDGAYTGDATSAATNIPAGAPDAPQNLKATPADKKLTVTWAAPENDGGSDITKYTVEISDGTTTDTQTVNMPGDLKYEFTGLTNDTEYTIKVKATNAQGDSTEAEIKATPKVQTGGGAGGGAAAGSCTVTYISSLGGKLQDTNGTVSKLTESVKKGETPANVPAVKADEGYKFMGWSTDGGKTFVDPARTAVSSSITYTAVFAKPDHLHYMVGYPDGSFRPNGNLTRAEAATMLSRLYKGFSEDGGYTGADFTDVTTDFWGYKYISFAEANGLVTGYEDGSIAPDRAITRGEFMALIARFAGIQPSDKAAAYEDAQGHWAEGYIAALTEAGIVDGYEDGSFRPNQTITRAEAAKTVNNVINRAPDQDLDLAAHGYRNSFTDVAESNWFFADVMEATIDHVTREFHSGK